MKVCTQRLKATVSAGAARTAKYVFSLRRKVSNWQNNQVDWHGILQEDYSNGLIRQQRICNICGVIINVCCFILSLISGEVVVFCGIAACNVAASRPIVTGYIENHVNFTICHVWVSFNCSLIDWGFNVPLNTLWVISGTGFTGQMIQPTVSKHWRK